MSLDLLLTAGPRLTLRKLSPCTRKCLILAFGAFLPNAYYSQQYNEGGLLSDHSGKSLLPHITLFCD
jgi:hypothetical protein